MYQVSDEVLKHLDSLLDVVRRSFHTDLILNVLSELYVNLPWTHRQRTHSLTH